MGEMKERDAKWERDRERERDDWARQLRLYTQERGHAIETAEKWEEQGRVLSQQVERLLAHTEMLSSSREHA